MDFSIFCVVCIDKNLINLVAVQSRGSPAGKAWPWLPLSLSQETAAPPLQTPRSWRSVGRVEECSCTSLDLHTTHTLMIAPSSLQWVASSFKQPLRLYLAACSHKLSCPAGLKPLQTPQVQILPPPHALPPYWCCSVLTPRDAWKTEHCVNRSDRPVTHHPLSSWTSSLYLWVSLSAALLATSLAPVCALHPCHK